MNAAMTQSQRLLEIIWKPPLSVPGVVLVVYCRCVARECQVAAHDLLVELADGCAENLVYIVSQLISMHHIGDPATLKEWEVLRENVFIITF